MILDVDTLFHEATPSALVESDCVLYPGTYREHKDYLLKLAGLDKHNRTPQEQLEKGLEFIKYLWVGKAAGELGGVLFICYLKHMDWWTLDAYKDSNIDNRDGDWSFRAANLVMDWFFKNHAVNDLYTIHRVENHAATKMCERLGFKVRYANPGFIILKKRRDLWV